MHPVRPSPVGQLHLTGTTTTDTHVLPTTPIWSRSSEPHGRNWSTS
jgi:hypothetical protein